MVDDQGKWTPGWRIMFGDRKLKWVWWHGNAPHCGAQVLKEQNSIRRRLLRMVEPAEPAYPCCYYTYCDGMTPRCGWFPGHWEQLADSGSGLRSEVP